MRWHRLINGSIILPSGEQVEWDHNSELILANIYGDYLEKTVQVILSSEIHYKYWKGYSINQHTLLMIKKFYFQMDDILLLFE